MTLNACSSWIVPIALAALALARRRVPESADRGGRRLDPAGQLLAIVALTAPVLAAIEAPHLGLSSWPVLAGAGAGVTALVLFLAARRGRDGGMMPMGLFRNQAFSAAIVVAVPLTFGIYGLLFLPPIYLQAVRGSWIDLVGLEMLSMALAFVAVSRRSGSLAAAGGARLVLAGAWCWSAPDCSCRAWARPPRRCGMSSWRRCRSAPGRGCAAGR